MTVKAVIKEKPSWLLPLLVCIVTILEISGRAQLPIPAPASSSLAVTLTDENNVAVPVARVTLSTETRTAHCETDFAGRCNFPSLPHGSYSLQAEKPGFYRLEMAEVHIPETNLLELKLSHEQEVRETVDVVESPPAIDPARTATTETLNQREILNVPYPTSRDIRNALPLLPQVVMDRTGNLHVAGSSRIQTLNLLDGFDVSAPAGGFMEMRVNSDSVRTIDVESSRYTAEYGRGDNVLGINTGIGDNQFRYSATNFLPSFQSRKGLHFNQWVPRATLSGPIKKDRIWFYEAPEIEYDQTIIKELPEGQDRTTSWRTGNLAKLQANITNSNIFTSEFVVNNYHAPNAGLSPFMPLPSTIDDRGATYMGELKDQHYFKGGTLLELGFAVDDFSGRQQPLGVTPYEITPEFRRGSFYADTRGSARRFQGISNIYLAPHQWHGRHELRIGGDVNRLSYHRTFHRAPISILREDGTLSRLETFTGHARTRVSNAQTGVFIQDRWAPQARLLIESGVRMDWDQITRDPVFGPRVAATYMLDQNAGTKLSAGIGLYYSATNLELISRPAAGRRLDYFYAPDGMTQLGPPVLTQFFVNRATLKQPRTLNWSLGLERKLPHSVYMRFDFVEKRAERNLLYANTAGSSALTGDYVLTNGRSDHYDAGTISLRHTFANIYPLMLSYTRSSASSNALLDNSVDIPVLGTLQGGALPWDAPNRIVGWGWLPFVKKCTVGYSMEWRDGFPFPVVNGEQIITGKPDAHRFPDYFTLAVALERRFRVAGMYLALRATAEDVTGHENPTSVNNNVSSPQFLTYSGLGHRVFTGRIRFLGRSGSNKKPAQTTEPQSQP